MWNLQRGDGGVVGGEGGINAIDRPSMIALGTRGFFLHVGSRLTDSSVEGWSHKPQSCKKKLSAQVTIKTWLKPETVHEKSLAPRVYGWSIIIYIYIFFFGGGGQYNRPLPSFPGLCIKMRLTAQPLMWKWFFILMQINFIFPRKVVHLASLWKWGFLGLWGGLFC